MEKSVTIEESLKRIEELEKENAELREELEYYRNRKLSGRQKHNAKWMAIYNDFVILYHFLQYLSYKIHFLFNAGSYLKINDVTTSTPLNRCILFCIIIIFVSHLSSPFLCTNCYGIQLELSAFNKSYTYILFGFPNP